jgi:hypothetical protein
MAGRSPNAPCRGTVWLSADAGKGSLSQVARGQADNDLLARQPPRESRNREMA